VETVVFCQNIRNLCLAVSSLTFLFYFLSPGIMAVIMDLLTNYCVAVANKKMPYAGRGEKHKRRKAY
jgi:hypothetical protein